MRRGLYVLVLLVLVGLGAWLVSSRSNNNSTSSPSNNSANTQSPAKSQPQTAPETTNQVSIQNFAFSPMTITVKKGTKVTWTNNDSVKHTATENDGKNGPSAPELDPGKSYSFTFNEVGTFHYHCAIHPDMTGTVTVTE